MDKRNRRIRFLRRAVGLYLALALLCNLLPFAVPVSVGEPSRSLLDETLFYGDATGPDRIALLETPTEALGARLAVIRRAEHTIDIAYHLIQSGASTDAVLGEILLAAERGVAVRILLDGTAGLADGESSRQLKALASHSGISYKTYSPPHALRPWEWQALLHDKFMAVDGKWLILGGRNLGDHYYAPAGYSGAITRDRDVLVCTADDPAQAGDSVLTQMAAYMDLYWHSPYVREVTGSRPGDRLQSRLDNLLAAAGAFPASNPVFYTHTLEDYDRRTVPTNRITHIHNPIHTGKKEPWVAYQMARLALGAQESVLVQTPYATADSGLLRTLAAAHDSTGNATLLTNSLASSPNYPAFSNYLSQRDKFARTGVQIYEYQSGDSIHGKSMAVDGRISVVGSLNLDDRSIYIDTESMLVIDSPAFAAILGEAMSSIRQQSLLVDALGQDYVPGQAVEPAPVKRGKGTAMWLVSWFSRLFQFLI